MHPTVEIVVSSLAAAPAAVLRATAVLSDAERARAERIKWAAGRRRFVVGRARLRRLIGTRLGVQPETLEFGLDPHGKPTLAGRLAGADLRFNVSHCDDLVVYAFSSGCAVGVDVEAIRVIPDAALVAARFFSPREHEVYRRLGFLTCWTRKEAVFKAIGHRPVDVSVESFCPAPGFIGAIAVGADSA